MSGMWGSTDENQLVSDSPTALAPGTSTEYSVKDSDLNKLYTLDIRFKQTGTQPVGTCLHRAVQHTKACVSLALTARYAMAGNTLA